MLSIACSRAISRNASSMPADGVDRDDRAARRRQRAAIGRAYRPRPAPMSSQRLARPDEPKQPVERRLVGPRSGRRGRGRSPARRSRCRRGPRGSRSTCVGVRPDPLGPGRLEQRDEVRRACRRRGCARSTGTSRTSSGCAARSGPSPRSPVALATSPNAGRASSTGLRPPSSPRSTGTTIGPSPRRRRRVEQRPMTSTHESRLVAEDDERRIDRVRRRRHARAGPSSTGHATGSGFRTRRSRAPVDRVLDRVGVVAQDDDDVTEAGRGERVEDVLQDRPALERRQQLAAPEPRAVLRPRGRPRPCGLASSHDRRAGRGPGPSPSPSSPPSKSPGVGSAARRRVRLAGAHPSPRHDLDRGVALPGGVLHERDQARWP